VFIPSRTSRCHGLPTHALRILSRSRATSCAFIYCHAVQCACRFVGGVCSRRAKSLSLRFSTSAGLAIPWVCCCLVHLGIFNLCSWRLDDCGVPAVQCGVAILLLYHSRVLLETIQREMPDVFCLQEVESEDRGKIAQKWDPLFALGYEHHYHQKVNLGTDAAGKSKPISYKRDIGNAVFWRTDVWELAPVVNAPPAKKTNKKVIETVRLKTLEPCKSADQQKRFGLTHVAVAVALRHKVTANVVVFASTHITPKFEQPDVQLSQVWYILNTLQSWIHHDHPGARLVLTGDFNSKPDSAVYQYLSTGVLPKVSI
jgi:endonuclease/exonuclease/phosphatase family metal-dependent hydrolase